MRIVLVGFGSVGRSVAEMLARRGPALYRAHGLAPKLVGVIDSRGSAVSPSGLDADALVAAKQRSGTVGGLERFGLAGSSALPSAELIRSIAADVVIESSPSDLANPAPAINNLKAGLSSAKHAISVNKAPLALAMPALVELARYNRVELRYSGSVGAGTPVLDTARTLSRGDRILRVRAILNGTTNYILWRMRDGGASYAEALGEAQKLGYAEADPSADVDGIDTATKIVILANAILGGGVGSLRPTIADVRRDGIRDIPRERIDAAAATGHTVKLIGEIDAESRRLSVWPQDVPASGPMDVPKNLNAVQFTLESAGEVTLVGRGAGGPETATSIIRDLVDIWNTPGSHD